MRKQSVAILIFSFALLEPAIAQQNALPQANPQSAVLNQSLDTLLLRPEMLGEKDLLVPITTQDKNVKIISGSRFPIEASDLPFSTYIITKEEIRQNGYETLVDALKMAPGIRVSQPGNAAEGETFLMRGLFGNNYTKILINDVPVKPLFVGGMPIGAQLPVKEAERIEIIYGAGAALYGADASAGVINIITRQSNKPVFMQADLAVGGGLYSSVNVLFGGRLGRGKNIFNYMAFGSNVLFEDRNIFYDKEFNYNPNTYFLLGGEDTASYVDLPNYSGTAFRPALTNTPHLSRKFGVSLNWRGITFSVESMYRRDHSSIGLNPLAVAYRNPLTHTGEGIWRFNLNFFKNKENKNRKTDFTYTRYRVDNRSSVIYVQNLLSREVFKASGTEAFQQHPDSVSFYQPIFYNNARKFLFDGLRYMYGWSDELRIERVHNYRILNRFSLTAGANLKAGYGSPLTHFISRPVSGNDVGVDLGAGTTEYNSQIFPAAPRFALQGEFNAFSQVFYNGKRINLVGGIQYSSIGFSDDFLIDTTEINSSQKGYSPRLAGLFKLSKSLKIRASWGKSFRAPSNYYKAISYRINSDRPDWLGRPFFTLEPEKTESLEFGLRWNAGEVLQLDLTWFRSKTSNLLRFRPQLEEFSDSLYQSFLGYRSDEASISEYRGGQLFLRFANIFRKNFLQGQYNLTWAKTKKQELIFIPEADVLPDYDGLIHQLRLIIRPIRDYTFVFDALKFSKIDQVSVGSMHIKGFFTLDAVIRYAFNERFDVYIKVVNVFDKKYPGIRATGTPDDLHYNPQSGFLMRIGMNYTLE